MDYYFNRLKSTVSSVAAQVSSVLPGNLIMRDYEILSLVGTAGPGLIWKIYSGRKRSTKQEVAVWILMKRNLERLSRVNDGENPLEILKRGVSQLTKLRHPRLLIIEHPLEDSRESCAFCSEPVFASLANCLGQTQDPKLSHINEFKLLDIEIRHGLFQIAEALAFLHNDARMLHRNICPESIIINNRGMWKLAGFDFAAQDSSTALDGKVLFDTYKWDPRVISHTQPSLDYMAPECINGGKCESYSDIYSFGILIVAIFNDGKPLFENHDTIDVFNSNAKKLKALSSHLPFNLPVQIVDDVKQCFNEVPDLRPNAIQISKISYFDDPLLKTLNYLDALCQMDNCQKMQFFKGLTQILSRFPKRALLQKIYPYLYMEFGTIDLIPFILPNIFVITEQSTTEEFAADILPKLSSVFVLEKPYQIILLLLQNMELLLRKTSADDVQGHLLPIIYRSMNNDSPKIQELCVLMIPSVSKLIDRESMRRHIIPKLLRIILDSDVLAIRVQGLLCIGKLLSTLESWIITDQILPALPKIMSREPGILMAVLGIYKLAIENANITREQCAKNILPYLISVCIENTLNLSQFEQFIALIHHILDSVENEQRKRLELLTAAQEDQQDISDFHSVFSLTDQKQQASSCDGLAELEASISNSDSGEQPKNLDDKKRLTFANESLIQSFDVNKGTASSSFKIHNGQPNPDLLSDTSVLKSSTSSSTFGMNAVIDISEFLPSLSDDEHGRVPTDLQISNNRTIQSSNSNEMIDSCLMMTNFPLPPPTINPIRRTGATKISSLSSMDNEFGDPFVENRRTDQSPFDALVSFRSCSENPNSGSSIPRSNPNTTNFDSNKMLSSDDPIRDLLG